MRCLVAAAVLVALVASAPVLAEEGPAPAPHEAAADELPPPPADLAPELVAPFDAATRFFKALVARDVDAVDASVRSPFYFEGKPVNGQDEVKKRWTRAVEEIGSAELVFYGIEVMPFDEMVKRYGKPPAKLAEVPLRGAVIAIANLSGRASIAALRRDASGNWAVFAFHD